MTRRDKEGKAASLDVIEPQNQLQFGLCEALIHGKSKPRLLRLLLSMLNLTLSQAPDAGPVELLHGRRRRVSVGTEKGRMNMQDT